MAPARVTDAVPAGSVFAPFHWGPLWSTDSTPNLAASEAFDARSKEPELKFAAVRLEHADAPIVEPGGEPVGAVSDAPVASATS